MSRMKTRQKQPIKYFTDPYAWLEYNDPGSKLGSYFIIDRTKEEIRECLSSNTTDDEDFFVQISAPFYDESGAFKFIFTNKKKRNVAITHTILYHIHLNTKKHSV